MLTMGQLLILLIVVNGLATMRARSDAMRGTLDEVNEVKALEGTAYNVLFDLCIYLSRKAPAFANGSIDLEAAVAEWELAVEAGVSGWQSIVLIEVDLSNISMADYDGRALDGAQMMVAGDEASNRCFTGEISIILTGRRVSSHAHFGICFLA